MWVGGTVPSKTMNAAGFYLLLLTIFNLLTPILNAYFLAQTISDVNRKPSIKDK